MGKDRFMGYFGCVLWLCWIVWALICLFPVLPAADTWMHLASGRYLVESGEYWKAPDPFSFGPGVGHWLNHQWLCQIIFYRIYELCGLTGFYVFRSLLVFLAYCTLPMHFAWKRKRSMLPAAVVVLLGMAVAQGAFFFDARCYIFTYLLLSWTLYVLLSFEDGVSPVLIWTLPPLLAVGSNLHGGYFIALAIVCLYIFAFACRRSTWPQALSLLKVLLLSLLLILLFNPYHVQALCFPFSLVYPSAFKVGLNEWARLRWDQAYHLVFVLAVLVWRRRSWSLCRVLLGSFLAMVGCLAWRHAPLVALGTIYLALAQMPNACSLFNALPVRSLKLARGIVCVIALAALCLGLYRLGGKMIGGAQHWTMETTAFPVDAARFLAINPQLPREIFNPYEWGGYLEFSNYRTLRCFHDGRANTLYSERRYAEGMLVQYGEPWRMLLKEHGLDGQLQDIASFTDVLDNYNIDLVLASRLRGDLVKRMSRCDWWSVIYQDDQAVIFVRRSWLAQCIAADWRHDSSARECCRRALKSFAEGDCKQASHWAQQTLIRDRVMLDGYLMASVAALQDGRTYEGLRYAFGAFLLDWRAKTLWYNLSVWAGKTDHWYLKRMFDWVLNSRIIAYSVGDEPGTAPAIM